MGRTARFVQNQWDGLVPGLERGEYDVVINGLEITPERAEKINFSNPYFYSTLTLTTRLDDTRIHTPQDLRGMTAGTLKVTFAERYLQDLGDVAIRSYDGQVNPYVDLGLGRLDAVVMDTPIALYYANSPAVKNTELPSARMSFGIGSQQNAGQLLEEINSGTGFTKKGRNSQENLQQLGNLQRRRRPRNSATRRRSRSDATRYREFLESTRTQKNLGERLSQYWKYMPLTPASRAASP